MNNYEALLGMSPRNASVWADERNFYIFVEKINGEYIGVHPEATQSNIFIVIDVWVEKSRCDFKTDQEWYDYAYNYGRIEKIKIIQNDPPPPE